MSGRVKVGLVRWFRTGKRRDRRGRRMRRCLWVRPVRLEWSFPVSWLPRRAIAWAQSCTGFLLVVPPGQWVTFRALGSPRHVPVVFRPRTAGGPLGGEARSARRPAGALRLQYKMILLPTPPSWMTTSAATSARGRRDQPLSVRASIGELACTNPSWWKTSCRRYSVPASSRAAVWRRRFP